MVTYPVLLCFRHDCQMAFGWQAKEAKPAVESHLLISVTKTFSTDFFLSSEKSSFELKSRKGKAWKICGYRVQLKEILCFQWATSLTSLWKTPESSTGHTQCTTSSSSFKSVWNPALGSAGLTITTRNQLMCWSMSVGISSLSAAR